MNFSDKTLEQVMQDLDSVDEDLVKVALNRIDAAVSAKLQPWCGECSGDNAAIACDAAIAIGINRILSAWSAPPVSNSSCGDAVDSTATDPQSSDNHSAEIHSDEEQRSHLRPNKFNWQDAEKVVDQWHQELTKLNQEEDLVSQIMYEFLQDIVQCLESRFLPVHTKAFWLCYVEFLPKIVPAIKKRTGRQHGTTFALSRLHSFIARESGSVKPRKDGTARDFVDPKKLAGFLIETLRRRANDKLASESSQHPSRNATGLQQRQANIAINNNNMEILNESADEIRKAFLSLSEGEQEILRLFLEGMDGEEIANSLRITKEACRQRKRRAIIKLKAKLDPDVCDTLEAILTKRKRKNPED